VFELSRLAAARNDLATAKAKAAEFAELTKTRNAPNDARQRHELAGLIALAEQRYAAAVEELAAANQQDPRILYLSAVALRGAGNAKKARVMAEQAAKFNGLGFNYAYVRTKALNFGANGTN
jgi:Flp pilus assembly protein TadD